MPVNANRVVARFQDGRILKGTTLDFVPTRPIFHVTPVNAKAGERPVQIDTSTLKALFFVKDFQGKRHYDERKEFLPTEKPTGRVAAVLFKDGEVLMGTTQAYDPRRPGFFLAPVDPGSNNDRCYIVASAVDKVEFGASASDLLKAAVARLQHA
jgi:hypothetical protein